MEWLERRARDVAGLLDQGQGQYASELLREDSRNLSKQDFRWLVSRANELERNDRGSDLYVRQVNVDGRMREQAYVATPHSINGRPGYHTEHVGYIECPNPQRQVLEDNYGRLPHQDRELLAQERARLYEQQLAREREILREQAIRAQMERQRIESELALRDRHAGYPSPGYSDRLYYDDPLRYNRSYYDDERARIAVRPPSINIDVPSAALGSLVTLGVLGLTGNLGGRRHRRR